MGVVDDGFVSAAAIFLLSSSVEAARTDKGGVGGEEECHRSFGPRGEPSLDDGDVSAAGDSLFFNLARFVGEALATESLPVVESSGLGRFIATTA